MEKTTTCIWCEEITTNTGTGECDRCWELKSRIERDMELAEIILNNLKREE